jgi:3-hydroxyacyl-CoA dehydrogenase
MKTSQRIGVIGTGAMGAGIVQGSVLAGRSVEVLDTDGGRISRGRAANSKSLARMLPWAGPSAGAHVMALDRLWDDELRSVARLRPCPRTLPRGHLP